MSLSENYVSVSNRRQIQIKGIKDITSYDSEKVIFELEEGRLILTGNSFNVKKVDVENGVAEVTGELTSLSFDEKGSKINKSFLTSLFK